MIFYRIYFSFLSLFFVGWLYFWDVKFDPIVLIPAAVTLFFYLFQYKKNGQDYILNLISSNIFISLFFLSWPSIYITIVTNSRILNFYERIATSFVVSSVSIFFFSPIWGFFITLFPKNDEKNLKITIKNRLLFLLKLLGILYIPCLFVLH